MPNSTQLLTLPVRLGLRVAETVLRAAAGLLSRGNEPQPPVVPVAPRERTPSRPADPPVPEEAVEAEVVLAAAVAEEGAEDGAHAELTIEEPWPGYDALRADDLRTRLRTSTAAEAAAVELYERVNKERLSVIEAAEKRLAALS